MDGLEDRRERMRPMLKQFLDKQRDRRPASGKRKSRGARRSAGRFCVDTPVILWLNGQTKC